MGQGQSQTQSSSFSRRRSHSRTTSAASNMAAPLTAPTAPPSFLSPQTPRTVVQTSAPRPSSILSVGGPSAPPPPPYSPIDEEQSIPDIAAASRTPELSPETADIRRRATLQSTPPSTSTASHRRALSSSTRARQDLPLLPEEPRSAPFLDRRLGLETTPPAGSHYTQFHVLESPLQENTPSTPSRSSTLVTRQTSRQSTRRHGSSSSGVTEDPLALLRKYDTVIIVDDSVSMGEGGLWFETRSALSDIATLAAQYDVDGVDIFFLNKREVEGRNLQRAEDVRHLFDSVSPNGANSDLGGRLEEFLLDYLRRAEKYQAAMEADTGQSLPEVKPINFIVMTDGVPSDDPESVIVEAAKRLDGKHFPLSQVGIQFVQVGDDPDATVALQQLDDGISPAHHVRDIVDMTRLPHVNGRLPRELLDKILLGGINRKFDRKVDGRGVP